MPVRVLVLRTAGTNCDLETAHAFRLAGAEVERLHVRTLLEGIRRLEEFQILAVPGGFSYGDDLGAGTILAGQIRTRLREELGRFVARGRLVIGICNGFQVLVRLGLLPGFSPDGSEGELPGGASAGKDKEGPPGDWQRVVSLVENASGLFEDRWVRLRVETGRSPLLERGEILEMPVAHTEGRLVVRGAGVLKGIREGDQVAFRYVGEDPDLPDPGYPANPNGSVDSIAGLVNLSGNVLGLMPHPERHLRILHHPEWTRRVPREGIPLSDWRLGDGYRIFERAVRRAGRL